MHTTHTLGSRITELFDLTGKVAVISGAAQGMGQGIAYRFAEAGASIVVAYREPKCAGETIEGIEARGGTALAVAGDVSVVENVDTLVGRAIERFGAIDICVNTAGGYHPFTPFADLSEELWQECTDRNLKSCYFMCQGAFRSMIDAGNGGSIINIASVEATRPFPLLSAYSPTKAAVVSLTKSLALEAAPHGVRVNAISPGPIRTPNTEPVYSDDALRAQVLAHVPLGRIGDVDDIALAALYLASPAAHFVTGSELLVDGGFLLT